MAHVPSMRAGTARVSASLIGVVTPPDFRLPVSRPVSCLFALSPVRCQS